jgi:hypothetical protein
MYYVIGRDRCSPGLETIFFFHPNDHDPEVHFVTVNDTFNNLTSPPIKKPVTEMVPVTGMVQCT